MMGGARSLTAIRQFGQDRGAEFLRQLGFTRDNAPSIGTLHYLFRDIDHDAVDQAVRQWLNAWFPLPENELAVDGKRLRGSASPSENLPGVHVINLYSPVTGQLVADLKQDPATNEHKTAMQLFACQDLEGKIITGDAAFCQRDLSEQVLKGGRLLLGRQGESTSALPST